MFHTVTIKDRTNIKIDNELYTFYEKLSEEDAFIIALRTYSEAYYDKNDSEIYSPALKLIGKYLVGYRFLEESYWEYHFEVIEDMQS